MNCHGGRAKRIVPKAPPLPYSRLAPSLARLPTTAPPSSIDDNNQSVCFNNLKYINITIEVLSTLKFFTIDLVFYLLSCLFDQSKRLGLRVWSHGRRCSISVL